LSHEGRLTTFGSIHLSFKAPLSLVVTAFENIKTAYRSGRFKQEWHSVLIFETSFELSISGDLVGCFLKFCLVGTVGICKITATYSFALIFICFLHSYS
jgi:hypothetical protein